MSSETFAGLYALPRRLVSSTRIAAGSTRFSPSKSIDSTISSPDACAALDVRGGAYWVPIEGQWMQVPDRAVIRDQGNPIGEAVVWYVHHRGSIIISCFVPADAV